MTRINLKILGVCSLWLLACRAAAADWPQYLGNPQHTGDAAGECLDLPLGLALQVPLDDAVLTAPAVKGGRVYVVDQMGTCYGVDPRAGKVVWKNSPDGVNAKGSNTSSPCVVKGRVYYGTTAGAFHILDASDGKLVKTIRLGWPMTGAPTAANDSIYFQTLGAVLHCIDLDGNERWRHDHYNAFQHPGPDPWGGHPGSFFSPHYGGGEVAVAGRRVLASMGWDLFCLEDNGRAAKLLWCNRGVLGKDPGIPLGVSISDDWVYAGHPGTDGGGGIMRARLADGRIDRAKDFFSSSHGFNWAVLATPAVRGATVFVPAHYMGVHAYDFAGRRSLWRARANNTYDQRQFTPCIAAPVLTKDHCIFSTMFGDLHVVAIDSQGSWPNFKPAAFRFSTAHGKPIASSPAVADGCIYFGCDDGYLYGLSHDGKLELRKDNLKLHEPRSKVVPATGRAYGAAVASMDQGNSGSVDDPRLRPPFRLRWACRPFDLRVQACADANSIYFVSEAGTVAALEQTTGRLRWRRRLLGSGYDGFKQMLLDDARLFVTRVSPNNQPDKDGAAFYALDAGTGQTLWQAPWTGPIDGVCRTAPVSVGKVVAAVHTEGKPLRQVVRAYDAAGGKPLWKVELPGDKKSLAAGGCVLDGIMYFSCGQSWGKGPGATVALDPATGKVLWKTTEYHIHGYGRPAAKDGRLYLGGQASAPLYCLSASNGKLIWKSGTSFSHSPALGDGYLVTRGYGGHGAVWDLTTGLPYRAGGKEIDGGCPGHACSPVLLTSGHISYAVSTVGLHARDMKTGKILWHSLGFAPRACTSPIAANGRLFFSPNCNNMLYCFEPEN